mmetsp:Transcript_102979/g.258287  ORF Transcript_102979/g.258287 Transcript_102979/m.258287 type:complete len:249 (+) Transcript_102979:35-781(+)
MILISPGPPAFGLKRSAMINPVLSSSAIRRVNFIPPPLVAHTRKRSWSKSAMVVRMKWAIYLSALNSSSTAPAGEKAASAWLCKSIVRNRSAPAVRIHRKRSFGGIASPATTRLSCRAYSRHGNTIVTLYGASPRIASMRSINRIRDKLTSVSPSSRAQTTKTSRFATDCSNFTETSPLSKVLNAQAPCCHLKCPNVWSTKSLLPGTAKTTGGWPKGIRIACGPPKVMSTSRSLTIAVITASKQTGLA